MTHVTDRPSVPNHAQGSKVESKLTDPADRRSACPGLFRLAPALDGGICRVKLAAGLKRACAKRPVPMERLEKILDEIERSLQEMGDKEVPSTKIGDAVLAKLRETDEVAYVRFASVYLSFKDAGELMNEVQRLMRSKGEG